MDDEEGVAIIGLGFRLPTSCTNDNADGEYNLKYTPNSFWNSLMNKFDGIVSINERWSENYNKLGEISNNYAGLIPLDEWKSFDPLFFGINPSEVATIDPQQRVLLKCTWEALEDAMIDPIKLRGSNTSVFIGSSATDYQNINIDNDEVYPNIFGVSTYSIASRISYCFNFNGQSVTIDTACSSSLNAIQLGCTSIQNGTSNVSIAGGVNLILNPNISKSFAYLNVLSKTGRCKVFDESADGFVRSEGAGVVVLKNLKQAIKDGNNIYCIIKGSSSNVDGNGLSDKSNFYSPSSQSQADNIKLALKSTNGSVNASDIDYVEAHGTGTPTGDPIELKGISMVFKDHRPHSNAPLLVGSIKSNIGHCESASGVASLIKCCLMFKHQCFAPNIHFNKPTPLINFEESKIKVVTDPIPFNPNKKVSIAISNFGITGSNCCLILSQYKPQAPQHILNQSNKTKKIYHQQYIKSYDRELESPIKRGAKISNSENICQDRLFHQQIDEKVQYLPPITSKLLIPFSANSVKSLNQYKSIIESKCNDLKFSDFAHLQILNKPTSLYQRSVIFASNWNEFKENSNIIKSSNTKSSNMMLSADIKKIITVFVFCGQSSQYNTMALELYNNNEIFKQSMDLLDCELSKYYGYSVLDKLRSIKDDDIISIHDPTYAQPAICMVQASLVQLYKHWGIEPSFLVGHSLGEVTASYCSGMIDLDTFCYVVYHRSVLQSSTSGCGKMLSISISSDEFISNYSSSYQTIEIACYNSPTSIVVAGNEDQLLNLSKELKEKGIFTAMLGSLSSFHTSSQMMIKDKVLNLNFESKPPSIPSFSTTTSNLYDENTRFTAEHSFQNILNPVYFTQTITNLYNHIESNQLGNEIVFIEIAPHPTLSFYLKQMVPKKSSTTSNYFKDGEFISIYSPLHKKKNDSLEINQLISNLYCQNRYNINFKCQISNDVDFSTAEEPIFYHGLITPPGPSKKLNVFQLPLYQWDDQKYWKSSFIHQNKISNGPPIDHLGIINEYSPNIKSYETYINISRDPLKWLKGHMIKNKYYFPGCGYIDNILKIYPKQDLTIDYLEFKLPLILIDGVNQYLQTNISQTGKKDYKVQFHFKDNKTNQWVNSSNGNIQLLSHDTMNDDNIWIDLESIKNQCNLTKLSKNELYQYIKMKTGLSYTGYFQGVEQVYLGDDCSLSIVSTKQPNENSTSFFHTSILDCCLHGMIGLIDEKCQLIFEKIETLKYYSSNVPTIAKSSNECISVYSKINSRMDNSFSASITVCLMDGTVLLEIENVVCKSLTPVKDSLSIEYPNNELFTPYLQSIESLIPSPLSTQFKPLYKKNETISKQLQVTSNKIFQQFIPRLLLSYINSKHKEITLQLIKSLTIDQLKQKYCTNNIKYERLFVFVFESIKLYIDDCNEDINTTMKLLKNQWNGSNVDNYLFLTKSTRIISKLLFPLVNEDTSIDTPQSLFEDGLMDEFYKHPSLLYQNELVGDIIIECIKPIINEKMVFRILEFGGGTCSLSIPVSERINKLLEEYPSHEIDIEYTWSDVSTSFIPDAKNKLSKIFKNTNISINIIYKALDLEQSLIGSDKLLFASHYDIVIMSNVLHVVKDVKFALKQLYDLLLPNGHLLFTEPIHKSILNDSIFGVFDQWWAFTDTDIRKDRCTMDQDSWRNLLTHFNFQNIEMTIEIPDKSKCYLIQAQKPSLDSIIQISKKSNFTSDHNEKNNLIFYKNSNSNSLENEFIQKTINNTNIKTKIYQVSNIQDFNNLIKSPSGVNNQSIIYFTKSLDLLNSENFKPITLEYIQINQTLLEYKLNGCKHILLSSDSTGINYLASSIIGSFRYFCDFPQLKLYSISLESISKKLNNSFPMVLQYLINDDPIKNTIQKEFIFKNNKVYYERYKQELKLKNSFKSSSFEVGNSTSGINNDSVFAILTQNLEYQLESKQLKLDDNEIEVKIMAGGISYKDYLVYAGLIPPLRTFNRRNDANKPNIGDCFSGIVTRVGGSGGSDIQFKIGDQVYGIGFNTIASHVVVNKKHVYYKPSNITHCEAASIPSVYLTNLYSFFSVGDLDIEMKESILIHSAAGGVGLSALEILKWKGHKGPIFATVGSKEKEKYLLNNYGDIITAVYSSNNRNYSDKIKQKLKEIGWKNQDGVDLILNTLSSEFMDANFKCLTTKGRIVDLSITHLNYNEYTCNNKFKYNKGYHNIELMFVSGSTISKLLKKTTEAIENGKLKLIPIIEFSNSNIKESIEFINKRKYIGKIVINHQDTDIIKELLSKQSSLSNFSILKSNYEINNLGRNIIITGQSGIALEILKWIVTFGSHCVDNIIILSKSSLKWELELLINKTTNLINNKIKFHFKSVDVSNTELMNNAIDEILSIDPSINNIDSILHYAFTQIDCKVNEIDIHHLNVSHGAKTMGAINLHNQSIKREWKLLNFIMASSTASVLGSEDQCSYVSACNVLDNLSKYRISLGLPSICVNYGYIESTGFVAKNDSVAAILVDREGIEPISTNKILGSLDLQIQNQNQSTNLVFCNFNFKNIKNNNNFKFNDQLFLKFDYQINSVISDHNNIVKNDLTDRNSKISDIFLNKISELLSTETSKIYTGGKLLDYGADSLFVVQLKNWIDKNISPNLISIKQLQSNSIDESIQTITTHSICK
ncbi:hypothetical protein DICPUDRAFT_147748 [Dictyostelium purpureum]|uniref:Uncharacterized protein n=1 Tax=Dictyostelium purpureum TaxID=5786 RepID=F0Z9A8_DICPU|nr:uncharacterized protein DICPUDRAFT_147748 [Dictyostelium purpureum]EGC39468.1 hypothetical protein DICPUDRAFT_147748 [Dictyostelium purpureum]|eukprot:XP_003284026.1 hypothetical protein DICPUDRAFT_147748 [Dictyostelium purpureum]